MTETASPEGTKQWYPWYIAGVLSVALAFSILDRFLMSIVVEPVRESFALTDTQLGLLTGTSFVILYVAASIPLGRMADVFNRRMIIFAGVTIWSLATLSCGLATNFWQLFAARMVVGLGEAALMPSAMSLIAAYFSKENRSRGMAIYALGNSMGRATAFIGGGFLLGILIASGGLRLPAGISFEPWQGLFIIAGVSGFLIALLTLTIREPARSHVAPGSRKFSNSASYFWKNKAVYLRFFLSFGMILAITMALATWMVSLYVRKFGIPVGEASMIVGITSVLVGPAGAWCGGWITDRLISRGVVAAPSLMMAIMLAIIPFAGLVLAFADSVWLTFVMYMVIYFCVSASGPPGFNGVQMITPEAHRGFVSALFQASFTILGGGVGPLVAGALSDRFFTGDTGIGFALSASFTLFAIIGIASAMYRRHVFQDLVNTVQD